MRLRSFLLVPLLFASAQGLARAQDFGVMESAETLDEGTFKIRANPMLLLSKDRSDTELGAAVVVGYGFTPRFDAEGGVAFYDEVTFFGGNGEFWLVQRTPLDFSIIGGLHGRRGDRTVNATGVDLTFLPSKHMTRKLDLYAALDLAFEFIAESSGGGSFKTVHLVPGLEYRIHPDLDVLAEFGVGLNDPARHYLSGGLAYYFH